MVETKFLVHLCIPRSPEQCVELKKQVFECVDFRILPISVALNFSSLPSAKADVCTHLWVCVRGYVCECVYWRGRVSGPRLLLSVNIYWALLIPIISPVIWPFNLLFHRSCPSYKAFLSLVPFIVYVCVCFFGGCMAKRQSFSVPFLSLKDAEFLRYVCITAISTLQLHCCAGHQGTGILSPQVPQGREMQMSLPYFSQPPWSCDHADPPEDQVSKQWGSMGEHLSSSLFFLSPPADCEIYCRGSRAQFFIYFLISVFIKTLAVSCVPLKLVILRPLWLKNLPADHCSCQQFQNQFWSKAESTLLPFGIAAEISLSWDVKMECSICLGFRKWASQRKEKREKISLANISKHYPVLSAAFNLTDTTSFPQSVIWPEAATPVTPRVPQEHLGEGFWHILVIFWD